MTEPEKATLCVVNASPEMRRMIEALLRPDGWTAGDGEPSLIVIASDDDPVRASADAAVLYPTAAQIVLSGGSLPPDKPRVAFLPIPFPLKELSRAAARVSGEEAAAAALDAKRRTLTAAGKTVALTGKECAVLALLLTHAGVPVPREALEELFPASKDKTNCCRVALSALRGKLDGAFGAGTLTAVRGVGYILRISA